MQAGARVQAVADELRKHGLTLQNYASIREQTVGGFTQVRGGLCRGLEELSGCLQGSLGSRAARAAAGCWS